MTQQWQAPVLAELSELQELADLGRPWLRSRLACEVALGPHRLPVPVLSLGSERAEVPAIGFFGGVHGLERIGSHVVLAYLRSLVMRLRWDEALHRQLESLRLVFMPVVNPGGMWLASRANPQGVDLMRNAPVDADQAVAPLVGGHRLSPCLPWYRGAPGEPVQVETQAVFDVVEQEVLGGAVPAPRPFALTLDCHSGFGLSDRLWFPWASSRQPMHNAADMQALGDIMDASLLHHRYVLEPQCRQYLTHGDLWDHLYRRTLARPQAGVFLPLTLEMGSWLWVKKNPRQLFSRLGIFNPEMPHRLQRVLRRHLAGLDFMTRAAASWQRWLPQGAERRQRHHQAMARWYAPQR
ncbi:MAG: hypothetical protein RIQ60_2645 [Pseudomonadota bacterium]|jgi:hypothetical protein